MTDTTISSSSTSAQTVSAGNRLIISASGILKPSGPAISWNLATSGLETVINNGSIAPTSGRAFDVSGTASSPVSVTINNFGSITGASDVMRTNNKSLAGGDITVDNAGTITANAGRGFNIQEYVNLAHFTYTNETGSTLQSMDDAIRLTTQTTGATTAANAAFNGIISISNSGTIKTVGSGSGQAIDLNDVNATSAGHVTITNNAGARIEAADADAIRASRFADIENYGTIQSKNATSSSTGNDGIDFQANDGGVINNYQGGAIIGARHGITGDAPITISNDGTITGQLGGGINLDTASTTTTTIVNNAHGVITGNAGGSTDGDGIDVDGLVNITNSGDIEAAGHATSFTAPDTSPPLNEAITVGGGSILNTSSGVIHSVERAITVDDSNGGNAFAATTITNHGVITGDNGSAISITDTYADTITNDGTINGSISTGGGDDIITNSGTLNGTLSTGSGNDLITLSGGSTAAIDGGDGSDSITISGGTVSLANVTNVETLSVVSGSATLIDTESFSSGILIGAGTLNISAALGASTPSVSFTSGAGTLALAAAALNSDDFAAQINGFGTDDKIDLKGVGLETSVTLGANNLLTVSGASGSITLHLDPTQNLSGDRFSLTSDGAGGTYVTHAADTAPVAQAATVSTNEDTVLNGMVTADDANNDTLSYALVSGPAHGSLTFNADGSYTYTPGQDYNGGDSFSFKANDGTLDSQAATISIGVNPVNDAPALTGTQTALPHATEDTAYIVTTAQLTSGFTDVDGDTLAVSGLSASSGSVHDNGDGTFTITPVANANGDVALHYEVVDGHGGTAEATLSYTIDPVDDAPNGLSLSADNVAENSARGTVIGSFTASDIDSTSFTYMLVDSAGGRFAINASTGLLSVANSKLLDYESATHHDIDVRVTDSDGLSYDQHFTINVTNVAETNVYAGTAGADNWTAPSDDPWYVNGKAGNDILTTGAGNDVITGGAGNDVLHSGAGDDMFLIGSGNGVDAIDGGAGFDRIVATANNVSIGLSSITGVEEISSGGFDNVKIVGTTGNDTLDFTSVTMAGIASINGGNGNDIIQGSLSDDHIIGGAGADTLSGGAGNDLFIYTKATESGVGIKADHILDFTSGEDRIDLSAIDANGSIAGHQSFTFIGSDAFTGLGQLRVGADGGHVALFGNISGNLNPDFEIIFNNDPVLHLSDLVL